MFEAAFPWAVICMFSTEFLASAFVTPLKSPLINMFSSTFIAPLFISVYFRCPRWSADPDLPLNTTLAAVLNCKKRGSKTDLRFKKTQIFHKICLAVISQLYVWADICKHSIYLLHSQERCDSRFSVLPMSALPSILSSLSEQFSPAGCLF